MLSERGLPTVGDGSGIEPDRRLYPEELQLALRNKALPLEGLDYDVTPTGMHYTLIHFDIPSVDVAAWHLEVGGQVQKPLSLTLEELQQRPSTTVVDRDASDVCNDRAWQALDGSVATWTTPSGAAEPVE